MYDQSNKEICISSLRAPRHNAPKQPLPKRQLLASIVPQCCKEIEFVWKNAALSAATVGRQPRRGGQVGAAPQHPNLTSSPCCDSQVQGGVGLGLGLQLPSRLGGEKSRRGGGKWTECCLCPSLWLLSRCCKFSLVICNLMIYSQEKISRQFTKKKKKIVPVNLSIMVGEQCERCSHPQPLLFPLLSPAEGNYKAES